MALFGKYFGKYFGRLFGSLAPAGPAPNPIADLGVKLFSTSGAVALASGAANFSLSTSLAASSLQSTDAGVAISIPSLDPVFEVS